MNFTSEIGTTTGEPASAPAEPQDLLPIRYQGRCSFHPISWYSGDCTIRFMLTETCPEFSRHRGMGYWSYDVWVFFLFAQFFRKFHQLTWGKCGCLVRHYHVDVVLMKNSSISFDEVLVYTRLSVLFSTSVPLEVQPLNELLWHWNSLALYDSFTVYCVPSLQETWGSVIFWTRWMEEYGLEQDQAQTAITSFMM